MRILPLLSAAIVTALPLAALAEETGHPRQLAAHQHGTAELNIAVEGGQVMVELISPAHNLLGFEHAPRSPAERERLHQVIALLEQGSGLRFNAEAGCQLAAVDIESELAENAGSHDDHDSHDQHAAETDHHPDHEHGADAAQDHSEFQLFYTYDCRHPERLSRLDLRLWEQFDELQAIRGQAITGQGQRLLSLQRGDGVTF